VNAVDRDEKYYKDLLASKVVHQVQIGEEIFNVERYDLIQRSVAIAATMGMGGCKTLSEFVDMVDSEDPSLIESIMFAIGCMQRRMYADPKKDKSMFGDAAIAAQNAQPAATTGQQLHTSNAFVTVQPSMSQFDLMIAQHGYSKQSIDEARAKVMNGEIKLPYIDVDNVKNRLATMSHEEFENLRTQLIEYSKKAPNFKLNYGKWNPNSVK
jgi:hypothetical protein